MVLQCSLPLAPSATERASGSPVTVSTPCLRGSPALVLLPVILQCHLPKAEILVVKHSHGPYMEPSTPFPPPFFPHPTKVILDQKPATHTGVLPLSTASHRWSPSPRRKPDSVPTYKRRQGSLEPSNSQPAHCRLAGAPLGV